MYSKTPWRLQFISKADEQTGNWQIIDADGIVVCFKRVSGPLPEKHVDNAYLLYAAPELLKALEDLYSLVVEREQGNHDLDEELSNAKAAIESAKHHLTK